MPRNKINLTRILVVFFMMFLLVEIPPSLTYGANEKLDLKHITSLNGLSHDTVYSIVQDRDGFMWFGSEDGLNKFDGNTIKVYQNQIHNKNSLQNTNCSALYVDNENLIWIASWGGGVEVFNPRNETYRSYTHNPLDPSSISDNNIQSIFEDSKGNLWFGTYTKGLNKFNPSTGKFTNYVHDTTKNCLSNNRVWSINEDLDGSLLIGTDKGLDKLNILSGDFTHFNGEIKNRVRTIYRDKSKTLWLGTQNGLCKFDTDTRDCKYYLSGLADQNTNIIGSIYEDSRGVFWIGTLNGLNIFNRETSQLSRSGSLSNNDIRAIYEDRSSNLWIGSRGDGINKINIKPNSFNYYGKVENSSLILSNKNVLSSLEDTSGVIWIGTNGGGLDKFDSTTNTIKYFMTDITKDENRNLGSIVEDTDSLWIGSLGGLNRFNKNTDKIYTYKNKPNLSGTLSNNTVLSIFKDSSETIWVGTLLGGLNKYNKNSDNFISYMSDSKTPNHISSNTVNCIYEDSLKNLWIGTQNGLNKFDKTTNKFTVFNYIENNPYSISSDAINCIYEDKSHYLWIGTPSGMNKFDTNTNKFKLYTTKEGLPNNQIHSIIQDSKGDLWISTSRNLSRFNIKSEKFDNYDALDGLQGGGYNNNACTQTKNGELIFCGTNGFDFFNPNNVIKSGFIPPIVITSFKIMDKQIDLSKIIENKDGIKLTYKDQFFSLEFSSLDFTKPEKNQYAYKLDGFDENWNYSGSRRYLSYTNLKSGEYLLRIKGTNSDGLWNEKGITIPITVVPALWANPFAYSVYTLILLFLIYLVIRYSIIKKDKKLKNQFQNLTMALSSTLDINEVLKRFLESFMQIIPYDNAAAILMKNNNFMVAAELGFKETKNDLIYRFEIQKIIKEIINTNLPYIINEAAENSWLGIPIIHNTNLEGIVVLFRKSTNYYGSKEGKIGNIFAAQAGFALKNANLYDELEKVNTELRNIYVIDELTGLYNRRGFNIHGGALYKSALLTGNKFILCFGDLDGLKVINDTLGHKEGDAAILAAAILLKKSFDDNAIIARIGGDEFTMIASNKSSEEEILVIMQLIKHNFEEYNLISKNKYKLSISLGFSVFLPDEKITFEELLQKADTNLYEEKRKRKNTN